jgi:copper chaperone NosL
MNSLALACACIATLAFSACSDRKTIEALPPPHELTASAIGKYCGMNLLEHPGPKGQIILESRIDPVWFSSARDAFSFTMLPEEPKDIRAIYVSDMGKAPNWDEPGAANWVDARKAFFVIGSRKKGGMGAEETVPFSEKPAAVKFATENGGRVMTFAEVPREYVLGASEQTTNSAPQVVPAAEVHKNEHAH